MIDSVVAACLSRELGELTGSRIVRASQTTQTQVELELNRAGHRLTLVLSCHPRFARVHTVSGPVAKTGHTHLSSILDHHIVGASLISVSWPDWERVIAFDFRRPDIVHGHVHTQIVAELMGKHANIIVVADGGRILDSLKRVGPTQSRLRSVYPGIDYHPPPRRAGSDPDSWTPGDDRPPDPAKRWLVAAIRGMSPVWARELCARADVCPDARASALTSVELVRLTDTLAEMVADIRAERFSPTGYCDAAGRLTAAWAFELTHQAGLRSLGGLTMDELTGRLTHAVDIRDRIDARRRSLAAFVRKEIDYRRQLRSDSTAVSADGGPERDRLYGELLVAYSHRVPRGADSVDLPDFADPEVVHTIPVDPQRGAIENARAWFDRYHRRKGAQAMQTRELERIERELKQLEPVARAVEAAESMDELDLVSTRLIRAGLLKPDGRAPRRARTAGFTRLLTPGGRVLLVGKNARQNDIVTFREAANHDLWLHARNMPGAHVIMRLSSLSDQPERECLEFAARIAAYYSDGRESSTVPIDFTRRKNVRRRPGGGPGQAIYDDFQTMVVRPAPPDSD